MSRKKTIPVPSEAIFDTVRRQYETSTLHLDAMADFLGVNEEKAA